MHHPWHTAAKPAAVNGTANGVSALVPILAVGAALALALALPRHAHAAQAQFTPWAWKDDTGHMVYSDRPPPASVPENRIVTSPANGGFAGSAPSPTSADATKGANKNPKDGQDDKLTPEEQEQKKKEQQERERRQKVAAENCQRANQALRMYNSGQRLATFNDKGERVILDDTARQQEQQRLQTIADRDCATADGSTP